MRDDLSALLDDHGLSPSATTFPSVHSPQPAAGGIGWAVALVLGAGVAGMLALVVVVTAWLLVRSPAKMTTPDLPLAQAPATEEAPASAQNPHATSPAETQASVGATKANTTSPDTSTSQPKLPRPATGSSDAGDRPKRNDNDNGRDKHPSVREIIERIGDAVVYITIVDSFGDEVALGSGIVIDASGLVATNYHVIEEAAKAQVQFRDGRKFDVAGYRGLDKSRDLAILELSERPQNATALAVHAPRQPEQGEEVIAFGHPAGFAFTVHTGIVSAIRRTSELPAGYQRFLDAAPDTLWIQTNAGISGGNSGGPLVDARGNLLGLITWVAEGQNLGFAVHAKHLHDVYEQMTPAATPLPAGGARPNRSIEILMEELHNDLWRRIRRSR